MSGSKDRLLWGLYSNVHPLSTGPVTQAELAARLGISQSAYAQQESSERLRKSSLERIAAALGITPEQLDF